MEYGTNVKDPYQQYNSEKIDTVQHRAARFIKSRYGRYSSVSDMLDELGWPPLSQWRHNNILLYTISNGLAQVPFEDVLIEVYKGTRRKYNKKLDRLVIQLDSMDSCSIPLRL